MSGPIAGALLVQLRALQTDFEHTHQRIVAALEADDLRELVEASHRQSELCSEQGTLLAEYVAVVGPDRLQLPAPDRHRIDELLRRLRDQRGDDSETKTAGKG